MPAYKTKAQLEAELATLELELIKTREAADGHYANIIKDYVSEVDGLREANAGLLEKVDGLELQLSGVWGYFSPAILPGTKVTRVLTIVFDYESDDKAKHKVYVWATPGPEVGFRGWPVYGMSVAQNAIARFWRTRNQEVKRYAARR